MTMELREILAVNLRALMEKRLDLNTQMKIRKATCVVDPVTQTIETPSLTQSTIQRVLTAQVHATLDTLQRLADAFHVQPASLITPKDAKPGSAPDTSDFGRILLDAFEALPQDPALRADAYSACLLALAITEQQHAPQKRSPKPSVKSKKARE